MADKDMSLVCLFLIQQEINLKFLNIYSMLNLPY